jgi:hypothetical protein
MIKLNKIVNQMLVLGVVDCSSAEQQQTASATDEDTETASTQLGELDADLVSHSMQCFSSSATQSTSGAIGFVIQWRFYELIEGRGERS